ncbi:MAG TPA: HAMP domain-containing sensor histidine kinase, partial [Candidatus Aquilonibacter sp.]
MFRSIRLRLIASFMAAWLVFVMTVSAIVWLAVNDIAHNIVLADMNLASLRITRVAFQYTIAGRPAAIQIAPLVAAQVTDLHVHLSVVPRVAVLNAPFSGELLFPPIADIPPEPHGIVAIGPRLEPQSIPIGDDRVEIFPDLDYLASTNVRWLTFAILIDVLSLIPAWFLAQIVASRTLEPLLRTTRALEGFAQGNFSPQPVTTRQRTEIGDLARAYNAAVRQINDAFDERTGAMEEMRQFVADAGHQLRTPLTVLMGHVSALHPKTARETTVFGNMLAQCRRMKAIIDDLIVLARLEHGEHSVFTIDLHRLTEQVVTSFADGGYARVVLHADGGVLARVNPGEIVDALSALIENALKYTIDGAVDVTVASVNGRSEIVVEDHGPGMSEDDLAHAFDRFYRGDASFGIDGTGLGLSIVRRGTERSNGTVLLENTGGG